MELKSGLFEPINVNLTNTIKQANEKFSIEGFTKNINVWKDNFGGVI